MKSISIFLFLIITTTLVLGSTVNSIYAQDNPSILIKIGKRAYDQIQNQITDKTPSEIKSLFVEGEKEFEALENSLSNNDLTSAKEHFLSAMKIFSEVSRQLASHQSSNNEIKTSQTTQNNPTNELLRMYSYVSNLKTIAQKHNSSIDFSSIDQLFVTAKNEIQNHQYDEATQSIKEIKQTIVEINESLRKEASQQEQTRAQSFAQKYVIQLDRLIDHALSTGQSEEIIQKLESSKESLLLASSPSEIIKEVRNIMLIQQQYELSENKLLGLRISQLEITISDLSESDKLDPDSQQEFSRTIQTIKDLTSKSEFESASELIKSLTILVNQFQN